jgi:hypothetical protein
MGAIRNVILMQANLDRMDRHLEQIDREQDGFREAISRISERLVRVETVLEMQEMAPARRLQPKTITQEKK